MKKVVSLILLSVTLLLFISSCGETTTESDIDDSYLEGLEDGEKNIFLSLFNASSPQKHLSYADVWKTKTFSLSFTDFGDGYDHLLKCKLTLKDFTIDEGDEEKNIYFGIYSRTWDGEWNEIASNYEYFYMSAVVEDNYTCGSHTAEVTFGLYDNPRYVVTIIVIDGILYNAVYEVEN